MNSKIKKIDSIKGMAVFQDFNWDKSVRDEGNNVAEFNKINILYGRNYSGKTTLSQIFRALEIGSIPVGYASPEFQLSNDDGSTVTQNTLNEHEHLVRVFNRSFVKDNLRFIVDEEQGIKSFAVLGGDNVLLEAKIMKHRAELETKGKKRGLASKTLGIMAKWIAAQEAYSDKRDELDRKLFEKANNKATGIKHNTIYGFANYNVIKLKEDIAKVTEDSYTGLSDEQVQEYRDLLKTEPKSIVNEFASFGLKYSTIAFKAKELIQKKIQMSNPIHELLNNAALERWVRDGRRLHEGERDKCVFCVNDLPEGLWEKLDKHFNHESEELRADLDRVLKDVESEKERVSDFLKLGNSDFYPKFFKRQNTLTRQFSAHSDTYCKNLESIKIQLEKRKNYIFTPLTFDAPISVEDDLNALGSSFEELINDSNQYTDSLSIKQSHVRVALRHHEVFTYITDTKYEAELKAIKGLKGKLDAADKSKVDAKAYLEKKHVEIKKLKGQLMDERKGAGRVNDYLNGFFGHQSLYLKAFKETSKGTPTGYRFEVTRNGEKALHMSEGERSLIAFCYFMAKLEDIETKGRQPIIWIDDPVSSLDGNHVFFVYSLIRTAIVKSKKFTQLFISTHNLEFLKYLRRISPDYKGKDPNKIKIREYFLIERSNNSSKLCLMPQYLKDHVTEFNYLFHQIYKCATIESISGGNHYDCYNFGNNARKFLEIYLYYKYPNRGKTYETLQLFFDKNTVSATLIDRVINDYSHGNFERGVAPIDGAEMKKAARDILLNIKQKDQDQYSGLLKSIGVKKDPL